MLNTDLALAMYQDRADRLRADAARSRLAASLRRQRRNAQGPRWFRRS